MSELRNIVLTGELGRKFGRNHKFAVKTPAEAIRALCANFPDFERHVTEASANGVGYRVIAGNSDTAIDALHNPTGRAEIKIIPVIGGGKGGLFEVLSGIAMIAVSFVPGLNVAVWSGAAATWSSVAFSVGVSLALGGVSQMLAPHPKTQAQSAQSYGFSGPINTLAQGSVVPVGYGRLIVGSVPISAGVTLDQVPTTETGPRNLSATVTEANGVFTLFAQWDAAGLATGYDVFISGLPNQPLPRTNGTSISYTVPTAGPYSVTVKPVEQDESYGPSATCSTGGAVVNSTGGRVAPVMGFKDSKSGGSGATIAPDTLSSRAYAQVVDLIAEGEVEGLANGLQSVYLDGTPLMNADGSYNFSGLSFAAAYGTPDQDYIPGFNDVENDVGVGVQVRHDTPVVRTITSADVDAVRVIVTVPQLALTSLKDGSVSGTSVSLAIDVQANGGDFVEYVADTITGKASNSYQKAYRINLQGDAPWNVRVRRITPDSTQANLVNAFMWDSYVEIADVKLTYPNSAIAALRVDAAQFQSVPTRAFDMKLMRVRVPSNYDPETRAYAGAWDGTFKVAWTDNPAWCYYDLLTARRYGLGKYIGLNGADKWALYQIAQYCDELVPDGFGGQEPRFTCNLYLQQAQPAFQVLQDMAAIFRGMSYWASGSVSVVQDAPKDATALFTNANVVGGNFSYSGSSLKARHTAALVTWNDPANMCKPDVEFVPDEDGIARFGLVDTAITAVGCSSRGQAHRAGKWLLYSERLETEAVTFTSGLEGTPIRPGDVIKVADQVRAGQRLGGRIRSATANTVTLDSPPVTAQGQPVEIAGATLSVVTMDGQVRALPVQSLDGQVVTLSANLPSLPLGGAMWVLELQTVTAQLFRVITVKEREDARGQYDVTALAHNPSKYGFIDENLTLEARPVSSLKTTLPPPATATITQSLYTYQSSVFVQATFAWPEQPVAIGYKIAYRVNGGNFVFATTTAAEFDLMKAVAGDYTLRVWTVGPSGQESPTYTEATATLTGMDKAPGNVSALTATLDGGNIALAWPPVADLDLAGYEIRLGEDWATAPVVIENYHGTSYAYPVKADGNYAFMVRALNTSGYYSDAPATTSIALAVSAPTAGQWTAAPTNQTGGGANIACVALTGSAGDYPAAASVIVEYRVHNDQAPAPWTAFSSSPASVGQIIVTGLAGATLYDIAVSYRSTYGVTGARQVLGPITTNTASPTYADGTPIDDMRAVINQAQTDAANAVSDVDLNAQSIIEQAVRLQTAQEALNALADINGEGLQTVLQNETDQRVAGDQAQAATTALIGAKSDDGKSFIFSSTTAKISATESLSDRLSTIAAQIGGNLAAIQNEASTRATADQSNADSISGLLARMGSAEAAITTEQSTRASADQSNADSISGLLSRMGSAEAAITTEQNTRATADQSNASDIAALLTRMGSAESAIVTEQSTRASADQASADSIASLAARMGNAEFAITTEQSTRATADQSNANSIASLVSRMGNAEAAIVNEQNARAANDNAEASNRIALQSVVNGKVTTYYQSSMPSPSAVGDMWFNTGDSNHPWRWNGSAWDDAADTRVAALTGFQATATSQLNTLANTQNSQAYLLNQIGAMNGANTAFVLNQSTVFVDGSTSLGSWISYVNSRFGNNEASIASEASTRADQYGSLSSRLDSISSAANGNTASINSLWQTANGLSARASLMLDVNGHLIGWTLNNDGATGLIDIVANRLRLIDPDAPGSVAIPFQYSGGVISMSNVVVDTLKAGSVQTAHLVAGAITNTAFTALTNAATVNTSSTPTVISAQLTIGDESSVDIAATLWTDPYHGSLFYVDIYRDNTLLHRINSLQLSNQKLAWPVLWVDPNPPAGTYTYSIRMTVSSGSDTNVGFVYRFMKVTEFKR